MDKKSIKVGIIEIWTILAIVLHFCDVGNFAKWSVIDWPWHCGHYRAAESLKKAMDDGVLK